jgi:hypothetical protein
MYLTDKMAFELRLSAEQMAAVYEINLDYMLSMNVQGDLYGIYWQRRNSDLRYVLTPYQYQLYIESTYFYRPISWRSGTWHFSIYSRYDNRHYYYYDRPAVYVSYKGGHNRVSGSHYKGRDYNPPKGSGHGVGNWRHDGPGNGHPANGRYTTEPRYSGSTSHGTTQRSHDQGSSNWRQNANKNGQGNNHGTGASGRNNGNNGKSSTPPSTRSNNSDNNNNRSTSGHFGGTRK